MTRLHAAMLTATIAPQIASTSPRSIWMAAGMISAATSHRPAATMLPTRAWGPVAAAISAWNSRSRCGSRKVSVTGLRDPIGVEAIARSVRGPRSPFGQLPRVTRMSSSSTSSRLPGPPSTASNRSRTLCPANRSIEIEAVRHTPSTSACRPAIRKTSTLLPSDRSTIARSVSADDDVALWAKT